MATAPSTPRSGGHPEPLFQTTPTTAGIDAYYISLGDDWVSTARALADSDQPAQPVDDAVGDGGAACPTAAFTSALRHAVCRTGCATGYATWAFQRSQSVCTAWTAWPADL